MNEKKAKGLRQLVRHLMGAGKVDEQPWVSYGFQKSNKSGTLGTIMLDPGCGRAIYQKMKNNADRRTGQ
jgi:hypothetical protein